MRAFMRMVGLVGLLGLVATTVWAGNVTGGQVVSVSKWVLTVRPSSGEAVTFSVRWVQEKGHWLPSRPARTMLPALEAGETVHVTWTMDTKENRRRIDDIEITSPLQRNSRGVVVSRSHYQLVIKPLEKPGTVTLNTRWVQVEGKWVPEPRASKSILALKPGDRATIGWAWDKEGRKRILEVSDVEPGPAERERE